METSHGKYLLQKGDQGRRGQISGENDHRTRIYKHWKTSLLKRKNYLP